MKQKFFCIIYFVIVWAVACNGQTTNPATNLAPLGKDILPFVEKHDLDSGDARGYVVLTIENPAIKSGAGIPIEVRFVNTGLGRNFYNPYFKASIAQPGQLALYDHNHKYLCDLLSLYVGSTKGESWDDWTFIPGGGSYAGFTMSVLRPNYVMRPLPLGDYYLQFIYYRAFIALDPPWAETDPDVAARQQRLKDFNAHFDRSELFRFNPVKITITK